MLEFEEVALFIAIESKVEALEELERAFKAGLETLLAERVFIPLPKDDDKRARVNISLLKSLLNAIPLQIIDLNS